jgi:hypothetical protein
MPRFSVISAGVTTVMAGLGLALIAASAQAATPTNYNCLTAPQVKLVDNTDPVFASQDNFNCFAWQAFINLTWDAKPGNPGVPDASVPPSAYGKPVRPEERERPTVWETFSSKDAVFKPDAAPPDPFGAPPSGSEHCRGTQPGEVPLFAITKLVGDGSKGLSNISQAGIKFGWVTAQNGQPTYYDVRLNKVEYDYIVSNKLYDAVQQGKLATSSQGLLLPQGVVEIKAAWLEIKDKSLWPRYRMIRTVIEEEDPANPGRPKCRVADMGLVAIHMIHKTALAQQFAWTTFEQIDNQPTFGDAADATRHFTYFNPGCDPAKDPYKCQINAAPCTAPNDPKTCRPLSAPNQVEKIIPMPPATKSLNDDMQTKIKAANGNSVYQYYQLVDTLWPSDNTTIPAGARTPLYDGNPQPPLGQGGLLNPLIETYFQGGDPNQTGGNNPRGFLSCQSCHVLAPIAKQPQVTQCTVGTIRGQSDPGNCASDYSFLFSNATCPKGTDCSK